MSKSDLDNRIDRQIVLDDLKKRQIDLTENVPQVPSVAWDAQPIRYFKLNQEWCKLLAGWLDHMESEAFWPDATGQDHAGIQGFLAFEEGINLPTTDLDCDAVELCLTTSETINNLIQLIENQQVMLDDLQEQLDEQEEDSPIDGVTLPPLPNNTTGANAVCRAANFVALQLTTILLEAWEDAQTLTIWEFVQAFLGIVWWDFSKAKEFWQLAQSIATPTLGDDAAAFEERIQQAFFCAELSLSLAQELVLDDSGIPELEKSLWLAIMNNYLQSQINEWAALGELQDTEPDCANGCAKTVVFDFAGTYVPEGDEIIYNGDTWEVTSGEFLEGLGYSSTDGSMTLFHALPEQCRVQGIHLHLKKHEACGSIHYNATWRGIGGEGTIEQTPDGTYIGDIPNTRTLDIQNAVLPSMTINTENHTCILGGTNRERIEWIRLFVSGATPTP